MELRKAERYQVAGQHIGDVKELAAHLGCSLMNGRIARVADVRGSGQILTDGGTSGKVGEVPQAAVGRRTNPPLEAEAYGLSSNPRLA